MLKKICKAKLELNEIINKKTKFLAQRLRWQEFEYGNKSGQFLANQLKINKEKTTICAVKDLTGDTVYDPERINNTFRDFYKSKRPLASILRGAPGRDAPSPPHCLQFLLNH